MCCSAKRYTSPPSPDSFSASNRCMRTKKTQQEMAAACLLALVSEIQVVFFSHSKVRSHRAHGKKEV